MTTSEFIKEKNQILREVLGLPFDLVPADQIEDVKKVKLSTEFTTSSCPYCAANLTDNKCKNCPMAIAGNGCLKSEESTWRRYITYCKKNSITQAVFPSSSAYKPLSDLIDKFNQSNDF